MIKNESKQASDLDGTVDAFRLAFYANFDRMGGKPAIGLSRNSMKSTTIQIFDRRIHSLPGAEKFYSKTCQMTSQGSDPAYDGLTYFESTGE